jgi:thymidylate synthase (FAD)
METDILVQHQTKRAVSEALESILYETLPVLDHGFIRVVDYMGDDSAVVQAARVSYGKGTKQVSQDRGLIHYLMRHRHTTPFEMCEIKLHVKLPIFVARQWIRHRTASINEYSARYSILSKEFYLPDANHIAAQSQTNKQGREEGAIDQVRAEQILDILRNDAERCYDNYRILLNEDEEGKIIDESQAGVARELARMNLNLNYYTEWYWKTNLHNLMHFLSLRADPHAQYEIRVYADLLVDILQKWVPITFEAFEEYRLKGTSFSGNALNFIKSLIAGKEMNMEESGMSKREWEEVRQKLNI